MRRSAGTGSCFRPVYGPKGAPRRGRLYWISYTLPGGRKKKEPAHTANRQEAETLLRRRLGAVDRGELLAVGNCTWENLHDIVVNDYKANGRRSLKRLEQSLAHLDDAFKGCQADAITADRVTGYVARRLEAGAARATVNRELAALKRALRLAARAGRISAVPFISLLREANARRGFFEPEAFAAVVAHLPAPEALVVEVAYVTGWRVASEILTRQWRHVDLKAGWIRLDPGETKSGDGRQFPLTPRLQQLLEAQRAATQALERETNQVIPWVFHRDGKQIRYFRRSWISACIAAGLGHEVRTTEGKLVKKVAGAIPHDFRRTAVRNLERAGVSRSAAMAMVGHKTQSIYGRYAICAESDLKEAAVKLDRLRSAR